MTNVTSPTDKLKIAFCLSELRSADTTESFFLQQMMVASRLQSRGHALTFFGPVNLEDAVFTPDLNKPELAPRTWTKSSWFTLARRLIWQVQRLMGIPYLNYFSNISYLDACMQCLPGHDIVWERYGIYKAAVAQACKRLKLPYILFFDGDDLYEHEFAGKPITGMLKRRAQQLTRYNLSAADRVICVSNAAKRRLVAVWGVPESKVEVFPNAVDVKLHHPQPEVRTAVRRELGIGDNPMFIFVGGFFYWHDIAGLLDAFAQVLRHCPEARLVLIGDGVQHAAMVQYAQKLQIEPYVKFTGSIPHADVPRLVNAADVAVAPYLENPELGLWGSPMKLFEYMACGAAIVATSLGQITEVMQDGYNGLLIPPSDVPALAEAMLKLIENPGLREQLGRQARREAEEKFSWGNYMSRLEVVFSNVIRRHADQHP